jgi:hypothetical protein
MKKGSAKILLGSPFWLCWSWVGRSGKRMHLIAGLGLAKGNVIPMNKIGAIKM